jgi:hypothetical protein
MECAHNCGLTAILVRHLAPAPEEFRPFLPHYYAPDCHALTENSGKTSIVTFTLL